MQETSPRFRSEEYFVYEISEEMFCQYFMQLNIIKPLFHNYTRYPKKCFANILCDLIIIKHLRFLIQIIFILKLTYLC